MQTKLTLPLLLTGALGAAMLACVPRVCVDFESPLAVGDTYGSFVGQRPGELAFTANNVTVTTDVFLPDDFTGKFDYAEILSPPQNFGAGQGIHMTNISMNFDFSGSGLKIGALYFEFMDFGGSVNINVNGFSHRGPLTPELTDIDDMAVLVTSSPITGGQQGTVSLTGQANKILIGGENLWIDNVCARQ